jgi:histidyl-tRNA synthetase
VEEVLAIAEGKVPADAPQLKEMLGKLGDLAAYCKVDFKIVRGLAYYTGIVWEIHDRKGELRAVAGGGRYDKLLQHLGGVDLPALGFGMGDVVLGELLKDRGLLPTSFGELDCYVVIADEALRGAAVTLIHQLRDAGIALDYALAPTRVGKQFQVAVAAGARFALTIGSDEWSTGEVKLKDLSAGTEERVKISELKSKLSP